MERAEIGRLRGKELVEKVNRALNFGLGVDANTYFEAVTECLDSKEIKKDSWPTAQALNEYHRSIGASTVLNEDNRPIRNSKRRQS